MSKFSEHDKRKIYKNALSDYASKIKTGRYNSPMKAEQAAKSSIDSAISQRITAKAFSKLLVLIAIVAAPFAIILAIDKIIKNVNEAKKISCKHKDTLDISTAQYDFENNKVVITCTNCEKEAELIPTISEKIKEGNEPTCRAEGIKVISWSFEDYEELNTSYEEKLPTIDHNLVVLEKGYEATCYSTGLSDKTECLMCGTIFNKKEIGKTSHVAVEIPAVEATCSSKGYTKGSKCKFCDLIMEKPTKIPLVDHDYEISVKEPTDSESGGTYHECKNCEDYYIDNPTDPLFKSKASYEIRNDNDRKYLALTSVKEGVTSLEIPKRIDGIPFEVIDKLAFNNNKEIRKVVLPEGLRVIGESAFEGASNLHTINFPSTLTTIGRFAFYDCKSLTGHINIPSNVSFIERTTFYNCSSISSVYFNEGVRGIEKEAFYGCSNLISVMFPSTMRDINDYSVFQNCNNIIEIRDINHCYSSWPSSVVVRHNSYTTNASIFSKDGFTYFKNISSNVHYMISCELEGKEITLPSSINGNEYIIRKGALGRLQDIETLNMNNVKGDTLSNLFSGNIPFTLKTLNIDSKGTIERNQFADCKSLEKITISDKIERIYGAFRGCDNVKEITLPGDHYLNYLFYNNSGEYYYTSNLYVPKSLKKVTIVGKKVQEHFMYNNEYVEEIIISEGVTEIEANAFIGSSNLKKVTIPSTMKIIYYKAFNNCNKLTNVVLPQSINYVDEEAFDKNVYITYK